MSKKIELTPEEIEDIHARGKLTPEEKVKDWIAWESCPFNVCMENKNSNRCSRFGCCEACLTDLANTKKEWFPIKPPPIVSGY